MTDSKFRPIEPIGDQKIIQIFMTDHKLRTIGDSIRPVGDQK